MSIHVNMDKAKDIWRDKWRDARGPLLQELDVEFLRAVESNDETKQAEVTAKKQELRNVTDTDINNIGTTDHLKLVWPQCLGDKPENL